jgi:arsenate reductase (thioredoxin)
MAEGWARHLKGGSIEAHSAGTRPKGLDPRAVRIMKEAGVDISGQSSKHVDDLNQSAGVRFDYVITVCDAANEACPVFPDATQTIHVGFDDPPKLAQHASTDEAMAHYRRVRDEIRAFIETLPQALSRPSSPAARAVH